MTIVNLIPTVAAVPVLEILSGEGRVIECYAVDWRADTSADVYFMVFDSDSEPANGDAPTLPGRKLCDTTGWDWPSTDSPFLVENGCWIALSSTPLTLTKLAASQDYGLTARVLP